MPARSVEYVFRGNFTSLTAGLTAAGRGVQDFGTKLTALDRDGAKMRAGLDTIGKSAGRIGLVAAAGLGVIVGTAAKFDSAMSKVQAATHETADNMDLLREAAIKAGAKTVYSASEAAGAIEALAKAGVSTKDILAGGLSGALNLAASDGIAVADAAEIAASALTQFNLAGTQTGHVADLLAAGAGKAQGGVSDLGQALNQSGLVAAQTGLSIEETVGALAEFANAGLIGSDAGTSFRTMLQALTPNSKQASDTMQSLGIAAYDAQGSFVGMTAFADSLRNGLKDLSVEQQNAALKTIFGSDAVRAASIIFNDGAKGVAEWQGKVNDAGYAADTAGLRLNNLAGDFEQLKGSLETALIGAGEGAQTPLRKLVQGATEVTNALAGVPPVAQNTALALAGVTAVTAGSLWFGTKVVSGITATRTALAALGIQATTTRATLAGLGTVGTLAGLGLGTILDQLGQFDSWSRSGNAADATVKSFQDLSDALSDSNVGKYASDLHINLSRLSQDLGENGAKGEYAAKVMADLQSEGHGVGAFFKGIAGEALPFYTDSATKANAAGKDLKNILKSSGEVLGSTKQQTLELADGTKLMGSASEVAAQKIQMSDEALKQLQDQAGDTASQFFGLGKSVDDSKVSLNQWINDLNKQGKALRDFTKNAATAAKKGLDEGLIQSLQAAGPAGALRLKELANASEKEIRRANRAWRGGQAAIDAYIYSVTSVPAATIDVNNRQAIAAIEAVRQRLLSLRNRNINVSVSTLHQAEDHRADGGLITGPGGPRSDSIPARLSNGEYVMPADAVAYYGVGAMDAMRAKRFADGVSVGGASTKSSAKKKDTLTAAEFRDAIRSLVDGLASTLGLGPTGPGAEIRAAFRDFAKQIRQDGGSVSKRFGVLEERLVRNAVAIDTETKKLSDPGGLNDQLANLTQSASSLASSVQAGFTTDIFSSSYDPFAASDQAIRDAGGTPATHSQEAILGAGLQQVFQDAKNASQFAQDIDLLKQKGFTGPGLEALANSNNLTAADALAGMTSAQLAVYNRAFAQRSQTLTAAGNTVSAAVYGDGIRAVTEKIDATNQRIADLTKATREELTVLQGLPPRIGTSVTNSMNGVAHAASQRAGR